MTDGSQSSQLIYKFNFQYSVETVVLVRGTKRAGMHVSQGKTDTDYTYVSVREETISHDVVCVVCHADGGGERETSAKSDQSDEPQTHTQQAGPAQ